MKEWLSHRSSFHIPSHRFFYIKSSNPLLKLSRTTSLHLALPNLKLKLTMTQKQNVLHRNPPTHPPTHLPRTSHRNSPISNPPLLFPKDPERHSSIQQPPSRPKNVATLTITQPPRLGVSLLYTRIPGLRWFEDRIMMSPSVAPI